MRWNADERCVIIGRYIAETGSTVRSAGVKFGVSKSTVHKDMTGRLREIDAALASEVRAILDENKAERHLRGGDATKRHYQILHEALAGTEQ